MLGTLRLRLRSWIRDLIQSDLDFLYLKNYAEEKARESDANLRVRLTAAENSLRLIEARLKAIEGLKLGDGEGNLGEAAARRVLAEEQANLDRLDASAAKLRGMTLDEYRADKERRIAAKRALEAKLPLGFNVS